LPVHAGVLQTGKTANLKVEILPGATLYQGSARSGVTSSNWGSYDMSFRFVTDEASGIFAFTNAAILPQLEGYEGQSFHFYVQGANAGSVWGSGPYTLDSNLGRAAVHAGALAEGQTGLVKVTILPGQNAYPGSVKNGITSSNWGAYETSFTVEPATGAHSPLHLGASNAKDLPGGASGVTLSVLITGNNSGSAWGSGPYTADSNLGIAAVHSGLLTVGQSAVLKVRFVPGQPSYTGSSKAGVSTSNWGAYDLGYILEK